MNSKLPHRAASRSGVALPFPSTLGCPPGILVAEGSAVGLLLTNTALGASSSNSQFPFLRFDILLYY